MSQLLALGVSVVIALVIVFILIKLESLRASKEEMYDKVNDEQYG